MKTIATFENSVNVLVRAYMNGTLEHQNCCACAVGNLVAAANNIKFTRFNNWDSEIPRYWFDACSGSTEPEVLKQISTIGYTVEEVIRIEDAFEQVNGKGPDPIDTLDDEWMFNGLIAVVNVLAEIHQVDLSVKEQAVAQFQTIHAGK